MAKTKKSKTVLTPGSSLFPIFKVIDGELVIARENIIGMVPFSKLLQRDNSPNKQYAYKEFLYIYLMYDINSEFEGLPLRERERKSIKASGLPSDYVADETVLEVRNAYEEIYSIINPQVKMYLTLRRGLRSSEQIVNKLVDKMENLLSKADVLEEGETKNLGDLVTMLNTLNSMAAQFPATISNIDLIFRSIKESDAMNDAEVYGGGNRFNREDPEYIGKKFGGLRDDDNKMSIVNPIGVQHQIVGKEEKNPKIEGAISQIRDLGISNE